MEKYVVQLLCVHEIEVEATDDLQAERAAFRMLGRIDQRQCIALKVLEAIDGEGALSEDPRDAMSFVRKKFYAIDRTWVNG